MPRCLDVRRLLLVSLSTLALGAMGARVGRATPALTMDVASGDVLYQQDATQPWFPASTTKLMTVFVALEAVRDHKIALDTPLVYSARARAMPPSKMGFRVGTQVTLENALRMLMVKSANDLAVTVAEGVSGSVEAFADDMNRAAGELGLRESHFVNPNGLPNADHVSSARDMALIARALFLRFPEQRSLFDTGSLALGPDIITNHNNLLGRYPGADGMKTGFTCPAGFNVVASAFRDGRHIVRVIMGAPSVATRTAKAAALFDRAFANVDRAAGPVVALPSVGGQAPDMRNAICHARSGLVAQFYGEVEQLDAPLLNPPQSGGLGLGLSMLNVERNFLFSSEPAAINPREPTALRINSVPPPAFTPVAVHIGADPGYQGPVAEARAPHSPIGSETAPAAVEAYAAPEPGLAQGVGVAPLRVDPKALSLRTHRAKLATKGRQGRALALKAAAQKAGKTAATTKVMAGPEGDAGDARKTNARPATTRRPGLKAKAAKPAAKSDSAAAR